MAIATLLTAPRPPKLDGKSRNGVIVNGQMQIPTHFADFDAFRRWCMSSEYPERGDVFWLEGTIWVSDEPEDLSSHNAVKTEVLCVLGEMVRAAKAGLIIGSKMRLVNVGVSLSVEPDLMYVSQGRIETGMVLIQPDQMGRIMEIVGSPDMVLEVIADASESKDAALENSYFGVDVQEYWRIDARGEALKFEILRRGPDKFVPAPTRKGRTKSSVFNRWFELRVENGPLGIAVYTLDATE